LSYQLTFYSPQSYVASTSPVAFVYHIDWPGNDLLNPSYHAYKINSANQVQTEIGLYQTIAAAESACQTDYTGPQAPAKAPQTLFAGGTRQTPIQQGDQIVYASSNFVPLTGGTMTGPLILNADPTDVLGAATKQYVDAGDITKPAHYVRVRTATESLNAAVANGAALQFDTIDKDTDGFAPTTSPFNKVTIPAGLAGAYVITAASSSSGTQATTLGMAITINNTVQLSPINQSITGPTSVNYTLDTTPVQIVTLPAGATIQLVNNSATNAFRSVFLALARLGA
jgi:hypothetical protein